MKILVFSDPRYSIMRIWKCTVRVWRDSSNEAPEYATREGACSPKDLPSKKPGSGGRHGISPERHGSVAQTRTGRPRGAGGQGPWQASDEAQLR